MLTLFFFRTSLRTRWIRFSTLRHVLRRIGQRTALLAYDEVRWRRVLGWIGVLIYGHWGEEGLWDEGEGAI
jgi:hypothetical protein